MHSFRELEHDLRGAVVIIDVDGTLVEDGGEAFDEATLERIRSHAEGAQIYLSSNKIAPGRLERLAGHAGVRALVATARKPRKRALGGLVFPAGQRTVVIGDKVLTDGLFAWRIGAEFIKVKRRRGGAESFFARTTYIADDILSAVAPYVRLLRPHQWIKNALVFAPLFFAQDALNPARTVQSAEAFAVFCLAASCVYIVNDLFDREADRAHPKKRFRPLAAKSVSVRDAGLLLGLLVLGTAALLYILPSVWPAIAAYVVLNILYSTWLKHIAIVDILCVAVFYLLRIAAGGLATSIHISPWLILCTLFGALMLIVGKRRAEMAHQSRRRVIDSYSPASLDFLLSGSAMLAVMSYGLYSIIGSRSPLAIYSTVFIVFVVFRLINRIYTAPEGGAETPETLIFRDPWALGALTLWGLYMLTILYVLHA